MDEALLEKISAYADGELESAEAAAVERALADSPGLRRVLEQFRALDRQAAALPVPEMEPEIGAALWAAVSERTVARGPAAGSDSADWTRVSSRLPEPPAVSEERWQKVWIGIRARTLDAAPASVERPSPMEADLSPLRLPAATASGRANARAERPSAFWWPAGLLAAAGVLAAITLFLARENVGPAVLPGSGDVAAEDLEDERAVLDDRYFMMVKHVPGIEKPVVCFFLKEEDASLNQFEY